jgi:hypothetical protein
MKRNFFDGRFFPAKKMLRATAFDLAAASSARRMRALLPCF